MEMRMGKRAPVTAILAVVSIITHNKIMICRYPVFRIHGRTRRHEDNAINPVTLDFSVFFQLRLICRMAIRSDKFLRQRRTVYIQLLVPVQNMITTLGRDGRVPVTPGLAGWPDWRSVFYHVLCLISRCSKNE